MVGTSRQPKTSGPTHSSRGMLPVDEAAQKIGELQLEIDCNLRDLAISRQATITAQNEAKEARKKQRDAERDLALLRSDIAQHKFTEALGVLGGIAGLPSGYSAMKNASRIGPPEPTHMTDEREAEFAAQITQSNSKIAELQEENRNIAERLGAKIKSLTNANTKLQHELKRLQDMQNRFQQMMTPVSQLAEACKQLNLASGLGEETDAEVDSQLISFPVPRDPALSLETREIEQLGGGGVTTDSHLINFRDPAAAVNLETNGLDELECGDVDFQFNNLDQSTGSAFNTSGSLDLAMPEAECNPQIITEEELNELEELLLAED